MSTPGSVAEDCLYLNITTPNSAQPDDPKPVMVFVHGGGFNTGSGSDYHANRLVVEGDVVVVTLNYRLGIFGFLALPGLEGAGTFALQDQQAALRWVQENIRAFGGDPNNITLFGESAGGDSVCAQLISPLADGLFDKAIVQSGSCTGFNVTNTIFPYLGEAGKTWQPLRQTAARGERVARHLGCNDPERQLPCLRRQSAERLLALPATLEGAPILWGPTFETPVQPLAPSEALQRGRFLRLPVTLGVNRDEGTLLVLLFYPGSGNAITRETFQDLNRAAFGDQAQRVAQRYPLTDYPTLNDAWATIVSDRAWACPNLRAARLFSRYTPTYMYEFADLRARPLMVFPEVLQPGVSHGAELAYLFDTASSNFEREFTPAQQPLASAMIAYWSGFAHGNTPSASGQPRWDSVANAKVLRLAPPITLVDVEGFARDHSCGFWQRIEH